MGAFTLAEVSSRGWGRWLALAGQLVLRGDVMTYLCVSSWTPETTGKA